MEVVFVFSCLFIGVGFWRVGVGRVWIILVGFFFGSGLGRVGLLL